jgi:hypothetical protein
VSPEPEQQKIWREALRQTRKIKDGLGMPVDKHIVETVAIMRLMGINTTMSCGGHLRRITNGPYVMFYAPTYKKFLEQRKAIGDFLNPKAKQIQKKAIKVNLRERQKLLPFLEGFYAHRQVPYTQRLIIEDVGFKGSYLRAQGADLAYIVNSQAKKEILTNNRKEMQAFTQYLKEQFFA